MFVRTGSPKGNFPRVFQKEHVAYPYTFSNLATMAIKIKISGLMQSKLPESDLKQRPGFLNLSTMKFGA